MFEYIVRDKNIDLWDRDKYLGQIIRKDSYCILNLSGHNSGYKFSKIEEFNLIFKDCVCTKIDFSEEFFELLNGIFVMNKLCER